MIWKNEVVIIPSNSKLNYDNWYTVTVQKEEYKVKVNYCIQTKFKKAENKYMQIKSMATITSLSLDRKNSGSSPNEFFHFWNRLSHAMPLSNKLMKICRINQKIK